jgi:hypothetical protein
MTAPGPTAEQLRARTLAASRREAMRLRARRIRRAAAGLTVTLFVTAFLIIYVQLASGHDPALVANAAKRRATAVSASQSSAAETSEPSSSESGAAAGDSEGSESTSATGSESTSSSGSSAGTEETSSSGASPVTTSQS